MIELDEAAVLTRAKAIATEDGFTWQLDFDAPGPRLRDQHFPSENRRQNIQNETSFAKKLAMSENIMTNWAFYPIAAVLIAGGHRGKCSFPGHSFHSLSYLNKEKHQTPGLSVLGLTTTFAFFRNFANWWVSRHIEFRRAGAAQAVMQGMIYARRASGSPGRCFAFAADGNNDSGEAFYV